MAYLMIKHMATNNLLSVSVIFALKNGSVGQSQKFFN